VIVGASGPGAVTGTKPAASHGIIRDGQASTTSNRSHEGAADTAAQPQSTKATITTAQKKRSPRADAARIANAKIRKSLKKQREAQKGAGTCRIQTRRGEGGDSRPAFHSATNAAEPNVRALGWERSTSREISHAPYTRRDLHLRLRLDGMRSDGAQPRSIKRVAAHPRES